MILKFYKPITSSIRHKVNLKFFGKFIKEKSLIIKNNFSFGRNNKGHITIRHRERGHKKLYRLIDFKRNKYYILGKVNSIQYDPNRNVNIALINYYDGEKRYILKPYQLKLNQIISNNANKIEIGNSLKLKYIPINQFIHNVEIYPNKGGQLIRAAGTYGIIINKKKNYVIIKLPSKKLCFININCKATIGRLDNLDFFNIKKGKAGKNRWLGNRPTVRGSAMNPCDHPHGGGNGKSPIGHKHPLTPWGKPTLGFKTRKKNYQYKK